MMKQIKNLVIEVIRRIRTNRKLAALFLLLIILIVLGGWQIMAKSRTDANTKKLYISQIGLLNTAVEGLPTVIKQNNSSQANLNAYFDQLDAVLRPCGQLKAAYDNRLTKVKSHDLKDKMGQVNQLCTDLTAVAKYSQNVYAACQDYLYFGIEWPSVNDSAYLSDLQNIDSIITHTKSRLENVDNSKVQDPALSELTAQLDDADKLAGQIQDALSKQNSSQASLLSVRFIKQINQDKVDFLNARNYFWNNTVQYDALQKAIKRLQDNFVALKV